MLNATLLFTLLLMSSFYIQLVKHEVFNYDGESYPKGNNITFLKTLLGNTEKKEKNPTKNQQEGPLYAHE